MRISKVMCAALAFAAFGCVAVADAQVVRGSIRQGERDYRDRDRNSDRDRDRDRDRDSDRDRDRDRDRHDGDRDRDRDRDRDYRDPHRPTKVDVRDGRPVTVIRRDRPQIRSATRIRHGTRLREAPRSSIRVEIGGRDYYRHDDDFFLSIEIGGGRREYVATRPPIGAVVHTLPARYEEVYYGGTAYYTCDDVYYTVNVVHDQPQLIVVEPPIGATIIELPPDHEVVIVRNVRYYRVGRYYFQPVHRGGSQAFLRVDLRL